jgi:fructokinase
VTFLVVGESLVDVVTAVDGSTAQYPGGSPANVAVGLGRLGLPVQLLTGLGDDEHGALLREHLAASSVELLVDPLRSTSVAHAQLDADGRATYAFDLAWELGEVADVGEPAWLHVGSLGVTQEPGARAVAALVARHADRTVVSYDPNCRPLLMGTPAAALPRIEDVVRRSRLVKLSDEDAAWLFPGEPLEEVARRWLALGPALVVVTCGEQGAQGWTADLAESIPVADGAPVRDTVGAGDAFMAGLIWSLADVGLEALSRDQLAAALTQAAVVARRTCERVGADPPWQAEL